YSGSCSVRSAEASILPCLDSGEPGYGQLESSRKVKCLSIAALIGLTLLLGTAFAATINTTPQNPKSKSKVTETTRPRRRMHRLARTHAVVRSRTARTLHPRRRRYYERFYASSFAEDTANGDMITGEDPLVRQA